MEPLKEYFAIKQLSDLERESYIKLYFSDITDPLHFVIELKALLDVLNVIDKEEQAVKMEEFTRLKNEMKARSRERTRTDSSIKPDKSSAVNNNASGEARVITLFSKNSKGKR